jgi:hypothetical protein
MTARRAPTGTVESTATSIAISVPATGDGISVSTLSVDTSRRASSTATLSPTFLSQRVTVPSLTLSPRAGIVIIVPAVDAAGAGGGVAATGAATGADVSTIGASATGVAAGAATGAGAAAPSSMIARSAPTGTVASTCTRIFESVPETGEGISVSTLSVDTSRSGSSTLM